MEPEASGSYLNAPETPASPPTAPLLPLPPTHFYSVEYPGYVKPTSVPRAISSLGGYPTLNHGFRKATTKQECVVEVRLRPDDLFAHPVPGDMVPTNNIVLKVVKRRRKRDASGEEQGVDPGGEYTVEALGSARKTVRFRSELWARALLA
jgi:general transcription factor 3C polypeptide 5 (transcription factor C subunit 1)